MLRTLKVNRKGCVLLSAFLAFSCLIQPSANTDNQKTEEFGFDLESPDILVKGNNSVDPLFIVVHPQRNGDKLRIRIEVWNESDKPARSPSLNPFDYRLEFRSGEESLRNVYVLDKLDGPYPKESDLDFVEPGSCLASNYLLPTFYHRIKEKNVECRVSAYTIYIADGKEVEFKVKSNWTAVPP